MRPVLQFQVWRVVKPGMLLGCQRSYSPDWGLVMPYCSWQWSLSGTNRPRCAGWGYRLVLNSRRMFVAFWTFSTLTGVSFEVLIGAGDGGMTAVSFAGGFLSSLVSELVRSTSWLLRRRSASVRCFWRVASMRVKTTGQMCRCSTFWWC